MTIHFSDLPPLEVCDRCCDHGGYYRDYGHTRRCDHEGERGRQPSFLRCGRTLSPAGPLDPVTGNAFADWLDEHGHPDAAAALREAFPLADGEVPS